MVYRSKRTCTLPSHSWNATSAARRDSVCNTINVFAVLRKKKNKQINHNRVRLRWASVYRILARTANIQTESRYLWLGHRINVHSSANVALAPIQSLVIQRYNCSFHFPNFTVKNALSDLSWFCLIWEGPDSTIPSLQLLLYQSGSLASVWKHVFIFSDCPPYESCCIL